LYPAHAVWLLVCGAGYEPPPYNGTRRIMADRLLG
jgi:hypothetical protein